MSPASLRLPSRERPFHDVLPSVSTFLTPRPALLVAFLQHLAEADCLVGAELERQMFWRESLEEVGRIERLAGRESTAAASSPGENSLHGFDHEWRGEGINIASPPDRAADIASVPDNNVNQEGLRRSSAFVGSYRWRSGGISKIAKRCAVEVSAKTRNTQVAGDQRNFRERNLTDILVSKWLGKIPKRLRFGLIQWYEFSALNDKPPACVPPTGNRVPCVGRQLSSAMPTRISSAESQLPMADVARRSAKPP
jgi:hypothetical protein